MNSEIVAIRRAILSVSDKAGLIELATALASLNVELLSTGGTAKAIRDAGIPVKDIAEFTGAPELFEGRVKTLHPKVHGGLLYRRNVAEHVDQAHTNDIQPVDLVVVNLYPFEAALAAGKQGDELIEQIDIGGPSMLRSAAKNHESVTVLCDPSDYAKVLNEISQHGGTSLKLRAELAAKVFARTANYDALIARALNPNPTEWQKHFPIPLQQPETLRYGENPAQRGTLYRIAGETNFGLAGARTIGGKEVSFNNWMDVDSCVRIVREFEQPACVVVKHSSPCGVATGKNIFEAYRDAIATDPTSAFGGVVAFNRPLDVDTANAIRERFTEVVYSPEPATDAVREVLAGAKNLRWIVGELPTEPPLFPFEFRRVFGGMLVEECDAGTTPLNDWKCVTETQPTPEQLSLLDFAWKVVKGVKSNAIVFANQTTTGCATVGIGGGETSRVDAVENALRRASNFNTNMQNCVLASDAFFPFPDGVERAAEAGVRCIVQPGGSIKDRDVIETANRLGIIMMFTGRRHFRHL